MLDFKDVTIDMKPLVDNYFKKSGNMGCEFTFSNLFIWRRKNNTAVAEYGGFLFVRYIIGGRCFFLKPVALKPEADLRPAYKMLIDHSSDSGCKLVIAGLTREGTEHLDNIMPGVFSFDAKPDWFDYIYNATDLINLKGSKYQAKRNFINQYERLSGTDTFEEMHAGNTADCLRTYNRWLESREMEYFREESVAVTEALSNFDALDLRGGLSRVNGQVCAFTVGAELNSEVFVVHIEKGLSDCTGVYAAINRDFARRYCKEYIYINREEDMGIEGLRKAKLSYYPAIHLEKFTAILKGT